MTSIACASSVQVRYQDFVSKSDVCLAKELLTVLKMSVAFEVPKGTHKTRVLLYQCVPNGQKPRARCIERCQ